MASPQAVAVRDLIRAMREQALDGNPTIEQQRAAGEGFGAMTGEPVGVIYEWTTANGVPALWAIPEEGADDRVLQYMHGGGYIIGSVASHQRLVGHLATAVGCRALSVEYRLAPEHPHPAAVTDSLAVYRWLLDQGFAPQRVAISGDSAGGGLAVATLLAIRDAGLPQPAAAVPMSPWVDLEGTGDSMKAMADLDLLIGEIALKTTAEHFLGGQSAQDPLAAPLHADLTGIAPLYIQVGGHETLLDDSTRLATRAAAAGVDVRLDVFPEMQHVFQMAVGNVPEADDAVARIGAYLRPRLGLGLG